MAKYIFYYGEFPIFIAQQERLGIFIGYFTAILVKLFGSHTIVIKLLPTLISLLYCHAVFRLAQKIGDKNFAWYAFLLSVFCPAFMTSWVVNGTDHYITFMTLGVYLLLLIIHFSEVETPAAAEHQNHRYRSIILPIYIGALMGLSFWIHPLSLTYILPGLMALFCTTPHSRLLRRIPFLVTGLALTLLPMIYYNLSPAARAANAMEESPDWVSILSLFHPGNSNGGFLSGMQELPGVFGDIIIYAFPVLWGGFEWNFETGIARKAIFLLTAFILGTGVFYFLFMRLITIRLQKKFPYWIWDRKDLILYSLVTMLLLFGLSQYKTNVHEPRYLMPFYFSLTLMLAWSINEWAKHFRVVGKILITFLLSVAIATTLWPSQTMDPDHTLWPRDRKLEQHLIQNKIKYPVAGFWVAYPLAFESDEKIWPIPILLEKFQYFLQRKGWQPDIVEPYYIFPNRHTNKAVAAHFFPWDEAPLWDSNDFTDHLRRLKIREDGYQKYSFEHYDLFYVSPSLMNPTRFVLSPYTPLLPEKS
ncbi:MAG: glycosyltransferase family 39 protein [SAR324 cluster bacterium]|nr:glycosyltransferase family 39 protein [SAR324 cluster bacterium]